jgi:hypothetical protein
MAMDWLLLFTVDLQMGQMSFFGTLVLVLFLKDDDTSRSFPFLEGFF